MFCNVIQPLLLTGAIGLALSGCASSPLVAQVPPVATPAAAPGAHAQGAVQPSDAFKQRAHQLVELLNGTMQPAQVFAPEALAKVSAERWTALAAAVRGRRGKALRVSRIEAETPHKGTVVIDFAESQVSVRIRVQSEPPHYVDGLMIK